MCVCVCVFCGVIWEIEKGSFIYYFKFSCWLAFNKKMDNSMKRMQFELSAQCVCMSVKESFRVC